MEAVVRRALVCSGPKRVSSCSTKRSLCGRLRGLGEERRVCIQSTANVRREASLKSVSMSGQQQKKLEQGDDPFELFTIDVD